jgi:hypothetical protein
VLGVCCHLELVDMPLGKVLIVGRYPAVRLLPHNSIILLYVMQSGASAENFRGGQYWVIGVALIMGGDSTTSRAVVITLALPPGAGKAL